MEVVNTICENCGRVHSGIYGSGRFCSSECSHSYSATVNNQQRKENIKKASDISIANGTHNGFSGNGKIVESYWEKELTRRGIDIKRNFSVSCDDIRNNNHYYRFDFLVNGIVDLEIDGDRFHSEEVSEKDSRREKFLNKLGYIVYRVPYINPKRRYKAFLKQVDNFISWLTEIKYTPVIT